MYAQIASDVSVLSIPLDELIIGIIAFLVVFGGLSKLALPGIRKALAERTEAIEGGLARSEATQAEANALKEQYQARLAEARTEAASIRAQAQADKSAILEEARREAAEVAAAVTARAEAQLQAERASTMTSLRREVGDLAVTVAGKVVGEALQDEDRVRATIDRFLDGLEANTPVGEAVR